MPLTDLHPPAAGDPAMTAAPPPDLAPLRRLLAAVRWRARGWMWVETCGWVGVGVALFFWGTLAADRLIEPPGWARGLLVASGLVAIGLVVWKLVGRLSASLSDAALAAVVERRHPEFRDSLSTAITLAAGSSGNDPQPPFDPSLVARTTAEAARLVPRVRPGRLFRRRRLLLLAGCGALLAGSVAGLAVARPDVAGLWARRVLAQSDEPWPRRVTLEVEGFATGVRTVARGSDVEVLVQALSAGEPPQFVELRWLAPGGWRIERMGTRGNAMPVAGRGELRQTFGHVLKGVSHDMPLEIRGGDGRLQGLELRVVDPPVVKNLGITYERPGYLGGGSRSAAAARVVRIPRGARVEIEAVASKPLAAAQLVVRSVDPGAAAGPEGERVVAELPAAGATTVSGRAGMIEGDVAVSVRLTDTDGIANREPIEFLISAIPDEPPRVAVRPRGISTAVTPLGRVPLEGTIADDHGLADATVRIDVVPPGRPQRLPIARVPRGATVVEFSEDDPEVVPLEPLGLAVGERLEMVVEARDACTLDDVPNVGTSDVWMLEVVSAESLRSLLEAREVLLRRRFESVIADLAQARDRLQESLVPTAVGQPEPRWLVGVRRLGEAASRAGGETGEIADAFLGIRLELDNNRLLTPEIEQRLVGEIAGPLREIVAQDLPAIAARSLELEAGTDAAEGAAGGAARLVRRADDVLGRLRAVLDRMMELESFNEVIERLRGVIRLQEEIRDQTLDEHKKRVREALGGP